MSDNRSDDPAPAGTTGGSFMRPQDWAGAAALTALASAIWALVTRRRRLALTAAAVMVASDLAGRWLSRRFPSPFRARFRFALVHSEADRRQLRRALHPQPGERFLELGPGAGHHAVDIAARLVPDGRLDVFDIQPEMLHAVEQRAQQFGVHNITCAVGDASQRLPYGNDVFDAAYLIGVLGELPDPDSTLRELRRVLKHDGRLVVGEVVFDPDFVRLRTLRRRAEAAGLVFERRAGTAMAFLACFRAPDSNLPSARSILG